MLRDTLQAALKRLGLDPNAVGPLKLLPAIYVAWADGVVEASEYQRIFQFAREHHRLGAGEQAILERWLITPPPIKYFRHGFDVLYRLAVAPDEPQVALDDLPVLLSEAEAIARTRDLAMDQAGHVDVREELALKELSSFLHLDNGIPLSQLVRELDSSVFNEAPVPLVRTLG